ncbi:MAG: hypothetical protein ACLFP1_07715 [Candidatus Goldiibacteriota bacterium]
MKKFMILLAVIAALAAVFAVGCSKKKTVPIAPSDVSTATYTATETETVDPDATNTSTPTVTATATNTATVTNTPEPLWVDNCDDGDNEAILDVHANGPGYWYTYDDYDDGGDSYVYPIPETVYEREGNTVVPFYMTWQPGYGDQGYAAQMTGVVTNTFEYGFVGMGVNLLGEPLDDGIDVTALTDNSGDPINGVKFWAKSVDDVDGQYKIKLASDTAYLNANTYNYNFTATADWTLYELKFDTDFAQEDWGGDTMPVDITVVVSALEAFQWQTHGTPPEEGRVVDLIVDEIELINIQ